MATPLAPSRHLLPPENAIEKQVCLAISNLANHVIATAASKTLSRLRSKSPQVFKNPALFFRALYVLDHTHFRLPVRRFILDLFALSFTAPQLNEVFEEGARLQAQAALHPADRSTTGSPNSLSAAAATARTSGNKFAWPSGQSSLMRDEASSTDDEEDVDESKLPPKQLLDPIVKIDGFLCSG